MILVDVNLLLCAEDKQSPQHEKARVWWDAQLSGSEPVGLCWPVVSAFLRISTNRRVYERPLALREAIGRVQSWFDQPCVRLLQPTEKHWEVLQDLLERGQAVANLVSDAHLAAIAIEHGCELCSMDSDFARFPGLKWRNPVQQGS